MQRGGEMSKIYNGKYDAFGRENGSVTRYVAAIGREPRLAAR